MRSEWDDLGIPNEDAYHPVETADFGGRGRTDQQLYLRIPKRGTAFPGGGLVPRRGADRRRPGKCRMRFSTAGWR